MGIKLKGKYKYIYLYNFQKNKIFLYYNNKIKRQI